jgi:putative ABC transport system permease protein
MNLTDIIALAWRNLRQSKLRTALTVIGVVVGVAAIITMVSFGIGLRQNIIGQALGRLDVFTSVTVLGADTNDLLALRSGRTVLDNYEEEDAQDGAQQEAAASPGGSPNPPPTVVRPRRVLDDEALAEIAKLDGVSFAVPIVAFPSYVRFNGRTRQLWASGARAGNDPRLRNLLAGRGFGDENADEVIIKEGFLEGYSDEAFRRRRNRRGNPGGPFRRAPEKSDEERKRGAEAALGREITLYSAPAGDAAPGSIFGIPLLDFPNSPQRRSGGDTNEDTSDGMDALLNQSRFDRYVFRIVGVLKSEEGMGLPIYGGSDFYLPLDQARRLREANVSPMERMGDALTGHAGYWGAELRVSDPSRIKPVTKSLTDLGFRAFSLTNQLEEIERIFLIINSSLALIGGIALLVASFGISNTMIMSIRERTREIGIMKAIGGSDGEIMRIFFVEASLIGLTGGVLGVIGGWGIDRVANALANRWILRQVGQAVRHIEFFSIPWYLSGGAILFAVVVSLVAAIYPALRAAKVDPIKALRYE